MYMHNAKAFPREALGRALASTGGISIFAFWGVLGVRGTCVFSGTPKQAKTPKNRVWGPVEAVSANFSGGLKVAHGDSATDEPKKSRF